MTESPWVDRIWSEFEESAALLSGVFVQAFDSKGSPLAAGPPLPPLCALLARYPASRLVCRSDCYRTTAQHAPGRAIVPACCHAGLAYRVVPVAGTRSRPVALLVGRVFTDLFGEEQVSGFAERYGLERAEYLQALRRSRQLATAELDRAASLTRTLASSLTLTQGRLAGYRTRLSCQRARAARLEAEVGVFHDLAEKILAAHSVEDVLPLALETAMLSLNARRGSILLAESGEGRITARAFRGEHAPVASSVTTLTPDSVSHRVFYDRRPLLVRDAGRELAATPGRRYPYASNSFVSVPLRENGHALGVLHLTEREGDDPFTPTDLTVLERIGIQASAAISRAQLEEEVRELRVTSMTDPLTGARNRRFLDGQLALEYERARRFGQPLAAVMIDIDDFKRYNDRWGHELGDALLRDVVRIVRGQVRTIDVLCRYGGDEFLLLLPETAAEGAVGVAEKVRSEIAAAAIPGGGDSPAAGTVTVSCGVAVYPESSGSAQQLLGRADEALLEAKRIGKNGVVLGRG